MTLSAGVGRVFRSHVSTVPMSVVPVRETRTAKSSTEYSTTATFLPVFLSPMLTCSGCSLWRSIGQSDRTCFTGQEKIGKSLPPSPGVVICLRFLTCALQRRWHVRT